MRAPAEQAYLTELARSVKSRHDGGTCDHCTADGCPQLTAAGEILDAYRLADEAINELARLWT